MLTVKIMSEMGRELIIECPSVEYIPQDKSLRIGTDGCIDIPEGSVVYVMNASGKTISRY